jgi:hypothetical protein
VNTVKVRVAGRQKLGDSAETFLQVPWVMSLNGGRGPPEVHKHVVGLRCFHIHRRPDWLWAG